MDVYRLTKDNNKKEGIKKDVIQLSENYNILSKFTSFLAIESEISNNEGYLLSTNVASQLPKNWKKNKPRKNDKPNLNNHHNYAHMPGTATNNPAYLACGILLLFITLFFVIWNYKKI